MIVVVVVQMRQLGVSSGVVIGHRKFQLFWVDIFTPDIGRITAPLCRHGMVKVKVRTRSYSLTALTSSYSMPGVSTSRSFSIALKIESRGSSHCKHSAQAFYGAGSEEKSGVKRHAYGSIRLLSRAILAVS